MSDDDLLLYRCTECGYICSAEPEGAIGTIHAHAEKHTPWWSIANVERLDQYVELIRVTEYDITARGGSGG